MSSTMFAEAAGDKMSLSEVHPTFRRNSWGILGGRFNQIP